MTINVKILKKNPTKCSSIILKCHDQGGLFQEFKVDNVSLVFTTITIEREST